MFKSVWLSIATCAVALLLAVPGVTTAAEVHGNIRSHIFHQSSCRYYSCPNCTAHFPSAKEAVANGYRACRICGAADKTNDGSKTDALYVGNTNTHKFHRASCRYAGCANCTARFQSREAAIKAGYIAGGCCSP